MQRHHCQNPWARYADDGVVHCKTKAEAEKLLGELKRRMKICKLELHPEKTRIVYCRNYNDSGMHEHEEFTFLGYTFRRRYIQSKDGELFYGFTPAVSKASGQELRDRIRNIRLRNKTVSIEQLANLMNTVVWGWFNYFSKFSQGTAIKVLNYLNLTLARWVQSKYKSMKGSMGKALQFIKRIARSKPNIFYHWQIGLRPAIG